MPRIHCLLIAFLILSTLPAIVRLPGAAAEEGSPSPSSEPPGRGTPAIDFALVDLEGQTRDLRQNDRRSVRAFVFVSTECPIANSYVPTLNRLFEATGAGEGKVEFFGVLSDRSVTRSEAKKHFDEYQAKFPVLFDASGQLREALAPTHVPEAFVVDADGKLVYRGAIDDVWGEIGRRKPEATKNWLADALSAAEKGEGVVEAKTTPVGCPVETWPADAGGADVTYCRDVAPILRSRCVDCHRGRTGRALLARILR